MFPVHWVYAISTISAAWLGVLLTLVLLPGMWLTLLAVLAVQFLDVPAPMSWWTVAAIAVLALLGEIAESASSAAGARRFGASRSGIVGALTGSILGAIAGTIFLPFIPILGTLIGAVAGAGLATVAAERGVAGRSWRESTTSGAGAAAGRAAAVFVKAAIAVAQAIVVTAAILL
jgi:hypothetical protein